MGLLNAGEEVTDVSTELVFYVNGKKVCVYFKIVSDKSVIKFVTFYQVGALFLINKLGRSALLSSTINCQL